MTVTSPSSSASSPDDAIRQLAERLGRKLLARGWRAATAESCTGGGIAAAITDISGSSSWFEYGLVTYADAAKHRLLNVSKDSLARHGAVSEAVVREMAAGALRLAGADLAVAVSGVAGPDGGSPEKPVGTVWLGWAAWHGDTPETGAECHHFAGDRASVRRQTVRAALERLLAETPSG